MHACTQTHRYPPVNIHTRWHTLAHRLIHAHAPGRAHTHTDTLAQALHTLVLRGAILRHLVVQGLYFSLCIDHSLLLLLPWRLLIVTIPACLSAQKWDIPCMGHCHVDMSAMEPCTTPSCGNSAQSSCLPFIHAILRHLMATCFGFESELTVIVLLALCLPCIRAS